ncbi:MAG: BON domain-containing protein [Gemmataceae bacterium]
MVGTFSASPRPLAIVLAAYLATSSGCDHEEVDRVNRVGQKVSERCQSAITGGENSLSAGLEAMRTNWNEAAVDTRVSLRLRWEKSLADAAIKVSVTEGVVELKGTIVNESQRQTAVSMAKSTVGVENVKDEMTVAAP